MVAWDLHKGLSASTEGSTRSQTNIEHESLARALQRLVSSGKETVSACMFVFGEGSRAWWSDPCVKFSE